MAQEIERKFLVTGDAWRELAEGTMYRQGYLSTVEDRTVRVRTVGAKGYLTVKGITVGGTRAEFEYEIPAKLPYRPSADIGAGSSALRPLTHYGRLYTP